MGNRLKIGFYLYCLISLVVAVYHIDLFIGVYRRALQTLSGL